MIKKDKSTSGALCSECPLKGAPYVPDSLPALRQMNIMFIGQNPGDTEQYTQVPFTGASGKHHWGNLASVGLKKDSLPHGNIVGCLTPGDRKPDLLEIQCCFPRLKKSILQVKPELIIALGEPAMKALTGKEKISSQIGRYYPLLPQYDFTCTVLCQFHPAFTMRARQWIPTARRVMQQIFSFLKGEIKEDLQPNFILDPDPETLRTYLDTNEPVGTDTETTGLDTLGGDSILGHSFSKDTNPPSAVAVYYKGLDDPRWNVVKDFLEDPKRNKIWQNGSYDTEIARTFGIVDQGFFFDTRLAQQVLNSDLPSDLDFLRGQYTNIAPYKPSKKARSQIVSWGKDEMLKYAAWDAITTLEVYKAQIKLLPEGSDELFQNLLIPLVRAIGRMERRGVRVNVETLAGLYAQVGPRADELAEEFYKAGINPRSPKQICAYFGIRSSSEDALDDLYKRMSIRSNEETDKQKMIKNLIEYRSLSKLSSVYLVGVYKRLRNGRIHTHFKIEGTGTGRLASQDPNLQNVPDEMRAIYEPDPGHVFLRADYKSIELWVGAILIYLWTGDTSMLDALQSGTNIHYITCGLCFPHVKQLTGDKDKDYTHQQVLAAKTVTFGTFYGRSARSIAMEFGVTVAEAESWQMKIISRFPGTLKYKDYCEKQIRKYGYLQTPFNRVRHVTSITQGLNFPVQSTASDITLGAIVESDKRNLLNWVSVHDELDIETPIKDFEKTLYGPFKDTMERKIPQLLNLSFKTDYEAGLDWYHMEKLNLDDPKEIKRKVKEWQKQTSTIQ